MPSLLSIDAPRAAKGQEPPAEIGPRAVSSGVPVTQSLLRQASSNIDPALNAEVEPNGTPATATPLTLVNGATHIVGNIWPAGDLDFYSFTAAAGDRVYAAIQAQTSASGSNDSVLEIYASDGTTILEGDEDDGSFGTLSSTIAGTTLPAAGTYYVRVRHNAAANTLRPYHLYFQLRSGTPTAETEPNDTYPGQALPAGGWVSGAINPGTDVDFYSVILNAGDTVYLSLDQDPERNGDVNLQLGMGAFDTQILVVNDSGAGFAPYTAPDSEAFFMTVKDAGTYGIFVAMPSGGVAGTYNLSATVFPRATSGVNCTTYTSTDVPAAIPDNGGSVSSALVVPGNPRIADLNLSIQGTHTFMGDLDVHLVSPAGNDNGVFTDVFNQTTGGRSVLDVVFDDEAAVAPAFQNSGGVRLQPEFNYRMSWFDGENAGGTWNLVVRDDAAGDVGQITGWSLEICEAPPPPACAPGFVRQSVYTTDFESGAAGFTHSGTLDEWELGLPATVATATANPVAAFNSCASGTNCWKTDLDNTYNALSNQDLLSPSINLGGFSPPVVVSWAHRYQMDTATNDHYNVAIQPVGTPASRLTLFEHLDAVMSDAPGAPPIQIPASAGWGVVSARADQLAGSNVELLFHLDSNSGVTNFGGVAIDDVTVTACRAAIADLSITKTDGVTTATPGGSVTYTVTAANAGPDAVTGVTVADTFPAVETCTWTCVGAGGGTCTASGAGNISDPVNMPAGGSVTYTASCTVNASATGTLSNTATVSSSIADPNPANNSATDTDTLAPQADIAVTKTDGVTTATPGGSVIYTITSSNAGPSNAPGTTVADTFPASLTCNWTCVGAGGGACTASGSGNISDTVNLPAGGSVTHTAACAISPSATGTLANTATAAAPAGVTDPTPANNSATDTDTLNPQADLSITKSDGVTSVSAGGATTYTVTASNAGPSHATGATVADTFPASLTCNWTCTGAGGGTCPASGSGNIGDTVNLPSGGSVTYTAACNVALAATGTLTNTATVTAPAGTADPTPANNSAIDTDTINAAGANIAATKTVTGTFTPGSVVSYVVVLTNSGGPQPDNPGNEFTDVLPANLALVSASASSGTAATSANTVSWNGPIPIGGTVTITINATILPSATGAVSNQGSVSYDSDANGTNDATRQTDDPAVGGAADPTSFTVGGAIADLSITKTDGVTSAVPGGSTIYTIVASNAGQSDAVGATVTDTFPASLTCTWTCAGAGGGTCTASGSGNIGDTVNLPAGGSVTYTAACSIAATATGSLTNTASVAVPAGANDPAPANNSATDTDTLDAQADLSITKTDNATTVLAGGTLTYVVATTNAGPSAAPGANVSDTFPAQCVSPAWTCTGTGGAVCTASGSGTALAETVDLPVGGTATFTVTCPVAAGTADGTVVTNTATVGVPNGTTDPTPGNNSATDTTTVNVGAGLSATKTVVAGTRPGDAVTYTVTINNGPGPQADNPGDEMTDVLPAALTLVSATASSGTAVANVGTNTVTWNGAIPAGGSVIVTITATINAGAAGPVANQATVSFDADADGSNESTGVSDDPAAGGAADPTVFTVNGVITATTPVPASGTWALLLTALGLLALAWRNRRAV